MHFLQIFLSKNYVTFTINYYCRHEDDEILQKGKWLAKYLIDTIKYNLTLSYTDNHLVSQFNVDNQPNNTSFQPLNAYSASTQSIIGHTQQINPGNYWQSLLLNEYFNF